MITRFKIYYSKRKVKEYSAKALRLLFTIAKKSKAIEKIKVLTPYENMIKTTIQSFAKKSKIYQKTLYNCLSNEDVAKCLIFRGVNSCKECSRCETTGCRLIIEGVFTPNQMKGVWENGK